MELTDSEAEDTGNIQVQILESTIDKLVLNFEKDKPVLIEEDDEDQDNIVPSEESKGLPSINNTENMGPNDNDKDAEDTKHVIKFSAKPPETGVYSSSPDEGVLSSSPMSHCSATKFSSPKTRTYSESTTVKARPGPSGTCAKRYGGSAANMELEDMAAYSSAHNEEILPHPAKFVLTKEEKALLDRAVKEDPTGRFGIGVSFLEGAPSAQPIVAPITKPELYCEVCNVRATDRNQLQEHLSGARHRKALKAQSASVVPAPVNPSESILASVIRPSEKQKVATDYSMHRTPSGHYYCQPCNMTMNSEEQFSAHVDSRKHKFKAATVKKTLGRDKET